MPDFWTYLLKCRDGSYYAGHTDDIKNRIAQHNSGAIPGYTYGRRPVKLLWSQQFSTRDDAFAAERQIKGWSRARKEALIKGDWDGLKSLASRRALLRDGASASSAPPQDERAGSASLPPIIILARPQLGENIGKAARAMLNFGLTEMRIVAPRDGWPNPDAGPAASGADIVLEKAQVFDSLADCVADISFIYATTVRKRGVTKPVLTPSEAAAEFQQNNGRSAILFGAERSGLEAREIDFARKIITVPINPEFGSLNLAQAVILCAYEWSKSQALESPPSTEELPPAPQSELDGMIEAMFAVLDKRGYFYPKDRTEVTKATLRNLLTKPGWNSGEVRTMRGVISTLETGRGKGRIKQD